MSSRYTPSIHRVYTECDIIRIHSRVSYVSFPFHTLTHTQSLCRYRQVIWLDRAQIQSNYGNLDEGSDNDDKYTFRIFIRTREEERSYTFTCDCASDKKVWVQHLSAAMVQARAGRACTRVPGWQVCHMHVLLLSPLPLYVQHMSSHPLPVFSNPHQ